MPKSSEENKKQIVQSRFDSIQQQADDYVSENVFEINRLSKSFNTIKQYIRALDRFEKYLHEVYKLKIINLYFLPSAWSQISFGLVQTFQRYLLNEGYAFKTINTYISAIKVHSKWAYNAQTIEIDTFSRIQNIEPLKESQEKRIRERLELKTKRIGNKKSKPTLLSDEQLNELIQSIDTSKINGKRNLAMFLIFIDLGFRVGEVVGLEIDNFDFQTGIITSYREKVSKTQKHHMSERLKIAVIDYLYFFPIEKTGALFISFSKNSTYFGTRLGIRSVQKIFSRKGKELGLGKPFSPHDLRHTWATNVAKQQIALPNLIQAGGWTGPGTALRYIQDQEIANEGIL